MTVGDYLQEGLLALIPFYEKGFKTAVLTRKNRHHDKRAIPWLVKSIARHYQLDLSLVRRRAGCLLKLQTNHSLAFTRHLVLIPVKLGRAKTENQTTMGYVSLGEIDRVGSARFSTDKTVPWNSRIIFKNGSELPALSTTSTMYSRISHGEKVLADYLELHQTEDDKSSMTRESIHKALPGCNCLVLDWFIGELGLGKKIDLSSSKDSYPLPHFRLSPELLRKKPGSYS